MPDPNFEPYQSKIPGDRDYDRDRYREERVYAGGAPCVVTVYGPEGRGRGRDCDDGHRHEGERFPPPATIPLSGNEQMNLWQFIAPFTGRLTRVVAGVLDFIRSFWPTPFSLSYRNATADTPTTTLMVVSSLAMVYDLVLSCACIVAKGSALSGTATLTFVSLDGTSSPVTFSVNLNSVGDGSTVKTSVMIAPGSTVSFSFITGGTYGSAQYNLFVSAIPQCSDKPVNATGNVMY